MKILGAVPRPKPFESPRSLITRTAITNGYSSANHMCRCLMLKKRYLEFCLGHGPFGKLLLAEAPALKSDLQTCFFHQPDGYLSRNTSVIVRGISIARQCITNEFRLCLACVEDGYTRFTQDLNFFDYCPYHNTCFQTSCPRCNSAPKWYQMDGFTCTCGYDFSGQKYVPHSFPVVKLPTTSFGPGNIVSALNQITRKEDLRTKFEKHFGFELLTTNQHRDHIENVLLSEINTYTQLPLEAFKMPWYQIIDKDLKAFAINLIMTNFIKERKCSKPNCCGKLMFKRKDIINLLDIESSPTHLRQLKSNHGHRVRREIFYSAPNICNAIKAAQSSRFNICHDSEQPTSETYMTLHEAACLFKTNHASLTALINIGIFEKTYKIDNKYYIHRNSAMDFNKNYVFASELADTYNLSTKSVSSALRRQGIHVAASAQHAWIPSFYVRESVKQFDAPLLENIRKKYVCSRTSGVSRLDQISTELNIPARSLKDLILNHFKFPPPIDSVSDHDYLTITEWRQSHFTLTEASLKLSINKAAIVSRFVKTSYIFPETWGRLIFVSKNDIDLMLEHLSTYYSVTQAAEHYLIGENKVKELALSGKLKCGPTLTSINFYHIMIYKNQSADESTVSS